MPLLRYQTLSASRSACACGFGARRAHSDRRLSSPAEALYSDRIQAHSERRLVTGFAIAALMD
jgi:hypothetical protein